MRWSVFARDRQYLRPGAAALASLSVLLVVQIASAPSASATNFGSTRCKGDPRSCVSLADNALHEWCQEGTLGNQISGMATATREAFDSYAADTDLRRSHHCPITSNRDVIVTDAYYGDNGAVAWTECLRGSSTSGNHPNLRCDQQKVRYNGYPGYRDNYNSAHARRSMACHEIGHTVGLRNRFDNRNSCMYVAGVSDRGTTTTAHDNNHINAHY